MANFRVRARTIDLLGRQQIANISTAISELFKNAHDAYADNVEVDYFRDDGLFVLRDDGLGMTKEDFLERWLTLGTDSKVGSFAGLNLPQVDSGKDIRQILGEKGIGRLAIAVIGRQLLILTRARMDGVASDELTVAYLHWGMFELPGISLEEIVVPVATFKASKLPDLSDVQKLTKLARENLVSLKSKIDEKIYAPIEVDMITFKADPNHASSYLEEPSFKEDNCGTHFYIQPADEILKDDIDTREEKMKATRFEKSLIGFTNTMIPTALPPKIITKFRDYVDEGEPIDRIGDKAFFSKKDFKKCDHHIEGTFDERGQFRGSFSIYQTEPSPYTLNWKNATARETACGPFKLSIAVVQGNKTDSLLEASEHARIAQVLNRHGGLYIYKDGIRVQPYGGPDYDFLDIERRRTLKASDYYYSFRRLMGAVELNAERNFALAEKAGREGFQENLAYHQFRSILMNFFIQSAADFFRKSGDSSDAFQDIRGEMQHLHAVRQKRSKQSHNKKSNFQESLDSFFKKSGDGFFEKEVGKLNLELEREIAKELLRKKSMSSKALSIAHVELTFLERAEQLKEAATLSKPRGVGLSKESINQWKAYLAESEHIIRSVVRPLEHTIEKVVSKAVRDGKLDLDASRRLDAAILIFSKQRMSAIKADNKKAQEHLTDLRSEVTELAKGSFQKVARVVDEVKADLKLAKSTVNSGTGLSKVKEVLENKVDNVFLEEHGKLTKLVAQLEVIRANINADDLDLIEVAEALEEENIALKERQEVDFELAQIGMALNTISHEFGKTAGGLRDGFRRMKAWAEANSEIEPLYNDMRVSFEHLDNYLSMFNPLDSRLQGSATKISGKEIYRFLSGLFGRRLERHNIEIVASKEFLNSSFYGFQSDFYPAFVNLVDNSIYWAEPKTDKRGLIELLADGDDLLIKDNGPGVDKRDAENIFVLNFTRKPGGRGMGLHISRQALQKFGYSLTLDDLKSGEGATFRISKNSDL